jgi:TorA maturation chaperone TorD
LSPAQAASAIDDSFDALPEDALRAQCYRLLARFLSAPPGQELLDTAAALRGDDSDLGLAIRALARVCAGSNVATVAEEYHVLFIGLVRGELVPYGSYYLTGFLHEKPLAKLRQDMGRLGVTRDKRIADPEDHIASLCEMMAGFIDGALGPPRSLAEQEAFYRAHIGSWAPVLFRDMETAKASVVYGALGTVGRTFLAIEQEGFAMVEHQPAAARQADSDARGAR